MDNTFILKLQDKIKLKSILFHKAKMPIIWACGKINRHYKFPNKNGHFNKWQLRLKTNMLKGGMMSVEQGINIYHLLNQVILMQVPGDIVELGCYEGTTAILLQMTLDQAKSDRALHVYDSFQGMPDALAVDGNMLKKGDLNVSMTKLEQNFQNMNVKLPNIHPGFFKDTLPTELPEKIAFAHLDGDFYSSIKESLENVYPRLSKNAVVVIDDYCDPTVHNVNNILPGVKAACDEFFKDKPEKMTVLIAGCESHGYFRKL